MNMAGTFPRDLLDIEGVPRTDKADSLRGRYQSILHARQPTRKPLNEKTLCSREREAEKLGRRRGERGYHDLIRKRGGSGRKFVIMERK